MRTVFLLFLYLLPVINIQAKNVSSIASADYFGTAVGMSNEYDSTLEKIDSLYHSSKSGLLKLRALVLNASLAKGNDDQVGSIKFARQAYDYAIKEKSYIWQGSICIFLSSQYRNIGLWEEGHNFLKKALEVNQKISALDIRLIQVSLIEQELAHYALLEKEYESVLVHISKSLDLLNEITDSPNQLYQRISAENLRGRAYLGLKLYEQAEDSFKKGLDILKLVEEETLAGFVYMGLGELYVEKMNHSVGLSYFKLAENFAESSNDLALKLALYKQIADFYRRSKDWDLFDKYSVKYETLINLDKENKRYAIQDVFKTNKKEHKKSETISRLYLGGVIILVLVLILVFLGIRIEKGKEYKKFQVLIDNSETYKRREEGQRKQELKSDSSKKRVLSLEAELKILEHLKRFEEELEFLKPTTSLSSLAAFCDTNTRYLSYVLNQNIGKDFNSYVNELRVKYGIEKLENDPVFKSYKISYLAEFLGFSSHSKFTAVFKEITDLAPSAFIAHLEKNSNEKEV